MKTIHVAAIYAGGFPLLTPQTLGTAFVQQDPHRNYVMTWSLNVQPQVTDNLRVVVGYVGSHAVHQQFKVDDSDLAAPNYIPHGNRESSPMQQPGIFDVPEPLL